MSRLSGLVSRLSNDDDDDDDRDDDDRDYDDRDDDDHHHDDHHDHDDGNDDDYGNDDGEMARCSWFIAVAGSSETKLEILSRFQLFHSQQNLGAMSMAGRPASSPQQSRRDSFLRSSKT